MSLMINFFMRFIFILSLFVIFFNSGCQYTQNQTNNNQANSSSLKTFQIKGKVISVDIPNKKVELAHEDIPGYMEAMTMSFPIRNADWVFTELTKDSDVKAELVVDNLKGEYWLEKVGIVAAGNPNMPATTTNEKAFAKKGENLPDFNLTNQEGKRISLKDFAGKAFAITFIYAKCPLPDFCIKMSTNFSDAANMLKTSDSKDRIRLLTVSFDPANDTPAKLKEYGIGYLGKDSQPNFDIWQLAVGSDKDVRAITNFIGLDYSVDQADKAQFNHSLRTVLIDQNGKVIEIISGNDWTPEDLIRKLTISLKQ